tara:strand:+ start:835 stop:1206 length:372 start_codon:yes stop_codon:yes gene_type:complete
MNLGRKEFLYEQAPPPPGGGAPPGGGGMPGMPGMGGPPAPPKTDEDKLWEKFKSYPKIDLFVQTMQQQNYADSVILDEIYKKFYPEFVYWVKEILQQAAKPPQQGGMPGMPGMPGPPQGAGGQ